MNNVDLITRAGQGDEQAWDSLVCQHQQAIFRLAYLLLGDADEAEDVAQAVFIQAFLALDKFDTSRPLRPWLLRITANLAHNRRRAIGRYLAAVRRWFQAAPERDGQLEAQMMEAMSARQWEAHVLWQAVRRLNQPDQEIIYLRYFLALSVAETSDALGVAPGTVKSRLSRAMNRLRTVIAREFPALQEGRDL